MFSHSLSQYFKSLTGVEVSRDLINVSAAGRYDHSNRVLAAVE